MTDRHEKWTPVEPGHVIPAGQPYREEYDKPEGRHGHDHPGSDLPFTTWRTHSGHDWFVDSSWRPPLVLLPTEPTWGIVRCLYDPTYRLIHAALDDRGYRFGNLVVDNIVDFIPVPLTDEQVARIEAAR